MSRGRGLISLLLLAALLANGAVRAMVSQRRSELIPPPRLQTRLAGFDSFSLGLLLGGLRGPLVMVLWTQSENLKAQKNLEGFDTMVKLIRLLQPGFDSVHIFQVWNLAYNVSVQMASLANKYAVMLDAIDYARSVLAERPDNVNLLVAMADVYFSKLGTSAECRYYIQRVRHETLTPPPPVAPRSDVGRRTRHEQMLDPATGLILPEFLAATRDRPPGLPPDAEYNNGAPLQYLQRYNTIEMGAFPDGLSPLAIGYNYYKQAQVHLAVARVKHQQLTDQVIDSRPAVALRLWTEEQWERGRSLELSAFGKPVPEAKEEMELPTAQLPLDAVPQDRKAVEDAIFSYNRAVQVGRHALEEYQRHIRAFSTQIGVYESHIDSMNAQISLLSADRDYLAALLESDPSRRRALLASAARQYQGAIDGYYKMILKYYVEDHVAAAVYPMRPDRPGVRYDKATIEQVPASQYPQIDAAVKQHLATVGGGVDAHQYDRQEYERYIQRATTRLGLVGR